MNSYPYHQKKLISNDELAVPSEEKVSKPKLIIVIFLYKGMKKYVTFVYSLIHFLVSVQKIMINLQDLVVMTQEL